MLRRPLFWVLFAAVSLAAAIFTFRYFSTAFPLVSIDLQMNRQDALRAARDLAQKYGWPPSGFSQAAQFNADQETQNFIELEGGGKPELSRILKQKIFAPYTWVVRHFKEGDPHESLVQFTPEGRPYNFHVKLPDNEKGASIPVAEARQIAESAAKEDWNVDFSHYELADSSKDDKPGGRTDHTFVYERQDERLGEGRYRLRLVVAGDKLTELNHYVQIPEAFTRRYEQMRSKNDAISAVSTFALAGYLLGFCGIGLFVMARRHWVIWRQPLFWGVFIAVLMGLNQLNSLPLSWMSYDTAVSATSFEARQVMNAIAIFGLYAALLTISFMAAETLSRRAFPGHVQLWKVWSRDVAPSPTILGKTLTGYLLVAPFFAYEIVLYFFAQGKLGWWSPSDTLVDPDIFANYVPSLSAISQAAQAGFWEECLFRAAPLSVAALLGNRFGKRRTFIAVAMVVQALVFASGHAGYANQPAYARVVELIIPALVFGGIFLAFGLLPGIVLHFAYDSTWMAMPLFVASGARAHIEQAIVVLVVLVPLWVVLMNRVRATKWIEVPESAFNGGWKPPEVHEAPRAEIPPDRETTIISPIVRRLLPVAGIIGLVLWVLASPFHTDAPPMELGRPQAIQKAREALAQRGIQLPESWTVLSNVVGQPGEMNRFVWQTAGREIYEKLLGKYVTPPIWVVRFARFQGDVAARAEEYQVYVDGSGQIIRVNHDLPEAAPGKNLTEDEARTIALQVLPGPSNFKEISADAEKRPVRTDWTFTFKDTRDYGLTQGEPRISAEVDGDQIVDTLRHVYVPDEWSRKERARETLPNILTTICLVILVSIAVSAAIVGAIRWSRNRGFSSKTFAAVFAIVFVTDVANVVNNIPVIESQANTAQPFALQVGLALAGALVLGVFTALGLGLIAGLVASKLGTWSQTPRPLLAGASIGLFFAGIGALGNRLVTPMSPTWGSLGPLSSGVPLLGTTLAPVVGFFSQTLILLAVIYALAHWRSASWIWIGVGLALAGATGIDTLLSWLILGAALGVLLLLAYLLVFRKEPALMLITTATASVLSTLHEGLQRPYPSALPGAILGSVVIAVAAAVWYKSYSRDAHY